MTKIVNESSQEFLFVIQLQMLSGIIMITPVIIIFFLVTAIVVAENNILSFKC